MKDNNNEKEGTSSSAASKTNQQPSSRKRRRQELDGAGNSSTKKEFKDDNSYEQIEDEEEEDIVLTPHTLRLLKLIQEGSTDHAQLAAIHLKAITAESSPVVLWDILGRLQYYLTSADWRTRQNASIAMEGVAQHLPIWDQRSFLQDTASILLLKEGRQQEYSAKNINGDTNGSQQHQPQKHIWLTVEDLKGKMHVILSKGRTLLAFPEEVYLEDEELEQLDTDMKGSTDFCEHRLQLQRQILAKRLGLLSNITSFTNQHGKEVVENVLSSNDDLNGDDAKTTTMKTKASRHNKPSDESSSLRALLVMEIRQQNQTSPGHILSHRNAQTLLAGELVYRMFDASWHVRHGSLMGISALVRAWKVHQSADSFGSWPHDLLARTLCLVGLDRFADYSGTSMKSTVGGAVAPVREMAGQIFSMLFPSCPPSIQHDCFRVLESLVENNDWEVRHGALVAMKYCVALMCKGTADQKSRPTIQQHKALIDDACRIAIARLEDESDDVQSVAAQLLNGPAKENNLSVAATINPLWRSIKKSSSVSAAVQDLVSLFATIVSKDCGGVLDNLTDDDVRGNTNKWRSCHRILLVLKDFLNFDYTSVQTSVLTTIASLVNKLSTSNLADNQKNNSNTENMKMTTQCISEIIIKVFDLYLCRFTLVANSSEGNGNEIGDLLVIWNESWALLTKASRNIQLLPEDDRSDLGSCLLLRYFCGEDLLGPRQNVPHRPHKTLHGKNLQLRLQAAKILSRFLVGGEPSANGTDTEMLYYCLRTCIDSPFLFQFESVCLLFQALFLDLTGTKMSTCTRKFLLEIKPHFERAIESKPRCLDYQGTVDNDQNIPALLSWIGAFTHNAEAVQTKRLKGSDATKTILDSEISTPSDGRGKATLDSMRVLMLASGALIAGGQEFLPSKLTPLIRAVMTSAQNDTDEACQLQNCSHLSSLLRLLVEDSTSETAVAFRKIFSKIFKNLFGLINAKAEPGCKAASQIIGTFANELPFQSAKKNLDVLWTALQPISRCAVESSSSCDLQQGLRLLLALCCKLHPGSDLASYLVEKFARVLVRLRCAAAEPEVRDQASEIIKTFCSVEKTLILDSTLPELAQFLQKRDDDSCRRRSCSMLRDIQQVASMSIIPYVRTLLPLVMPLMTDADNFCAKSAAMMFSRLVQVAPLVRESSQLQLAVTERQKTAELVMDHLIHGKKLPPCAIRPEIANDLRSAGVSLRGYQLEGVGWLRFLQTVNLNGALCDSMGLGKTLQALVSIASSHLDTEGSAKPLSLVICPSSVVGHWVAEIRRFFPEQKVLIPSPIIGTVTQRKTLWSNVSRSGNIVITSYSILRSDIDVLSKFQWHYCVLDEGHLLKNPKTATARASKRLLCRHKLVLSGTPVQNKVHEVWATFDFLMPNFLGSSTSFSSEFGRPITKSQAPGASASDIANGMETLKALHQQVLPFILRREKEHVLKELPPKSISIMPCQMSPYQKRVYSEFCSSEAAQKSVDTLQKALTSYEASMSNLGKDVLKSLLFLRLLCTHPVLVSANKERSFDAQYQGIEHSGKLMALNELLRDTGIQNRGLSAADNDSSLLYCEDDSDSDGDDELGDALQSGLDESLIQIDQNEGRQSGSRCLIFAQFMSSLDVVETSLLRRHLPSVAYLRLDGRVPIEERSKIVDKFNEDKDIKILLLTTRIGGLGLNLTGADTVIFLEHDWNPHADMQAMDRAHRIGQKKTVNVYKLVTMDTIEEKIMNLHETKLAMSNAIVNTDNSSLFSMGTDRLLDIFRFRSEVSTQRSTSSDNMDKNLDSLVELYEEEYKTLSMETFLDGLKSGGEDDGAY